MSQWSFESIISTEACTTMGTLNYLVSLILLSFDCLLLGKCCITRGPGRAKFVVQGFLYTAHTWWSESFLINLACPHIRKFYRGVHVCVHIDLSESLEWVSWMFRLLDVSSVVSSLLRCFVISQAPRVNVWAFVSMCIRARKLEWNTWVGLMLYGCSAACRDASS